MDPNLFKLICGSDMMDMIYSIIFSCFENPILQTLLDICFLYLLFYLFFNDNEINVNIPNFCPPVYIEIDAHVADTDLIVKQLLSLMQIVTTLFYIY